MHGINKQVTNYSIKLVDKITLYTFKKQGLIKISHFLQNNTHKKSGTTQGRSALIQKDFDAYLSVSFKPCTVSR
ncbi:hypothetical protein Dfri01_63160 [Dyadobacter frigoris]|nr:hypothetical protein Dfri01_63160 [Dyadobacter frigoris]